MPKEAIDVEELDNAGWSGLAFSQARKIAVLAEALKVYADRENWFRLQIIGYPEERWEWSEEKTEFIPWKVAAEALEVAWMEEADAESD